MTVYCLEMRNTQCWADVRYRDYTSSERRAAKFRLVPKVRFTDSSHGVVPVVTERNNPRAPRLPRMVGHGSLSDHVRRHT